MAVHRAYNKSFVEDGVFYKCSQEERLADEIAYYDQIPYPLCKHFPSRIQKYSPSTHHVLALEALDWPNLGQVFLEERADHQNWTHVCVLLLQLLEEFQTFSLSLPNSVYYAFKEESKVNSKKMYIDKTLNEYGKLKTSSEFWTMLLDQEKIEVNGEWLLNFDQLGDKFLKFWDDNLDYHPSVIHGDLCFSNILVSPDYREIKVVDPRGSFGRRGIWGDRAYDLAKLRHSYHGFYEAMIYDKFSLHQQAYNRFSLEVSEDRYKGPSFDAELVLRGSSKRTQMIEGLIFIGMCARHYDSFTRQLAMYLTGLKILNELL